MTSLQFRAQAEIELFGQEVKKEEWEVLTDEEYYDKIYRIDCVVDTLFKEYLQQAKKKKGKGSFKNKNRNNN